MILLEIIFSCTSKTWRLGMAPECVLVLFYCLVGISTSWPPLNSVREIASSESPLVFITTARNNGR